MDAWSRPALRSVESIVVPDRKHGRVLVLRDTHGVTDAQVLLPPVLVPIVARFDGALTCAAIAREASEQIGSEVPVEVVIRLANDLERGLFLEGRPFREARARGEREFSEAPVRSASHAGSAYYADAPALERYIEESCFSPPKGRGPAAGPIGGASSNGARMVALIAPHIDPWRGAAGYGAAYGALAAALPPKADTFVLFGTSHAPMREPFALCRKAFATPLGTIEADLQSIDALAASAVGFDPYADQFNHKREHSLEFQVVFLKHLLGERRARIVPILAGLSAHQARGEDPDGDRGVTVFVDAVRALVEARPGRVVVIAGADLAHVGPRFGDELALDADQRERLDRQDRQSIEHAASLDARGFWAHVVGDLGERRVCGLAPIWSLLRAVSGGARGSLLHYEQTMDPEDGSIVSHAALAYYA
ncbi:MAG: AmmeMemoRadiSam system protein B [Myxococcota bacterium]|nr:AmmeMemoRadiSam system protein B [Myxococcota bacterium]